MKKSEFVAAVTNISGESPDVAVKLTDAVFEALRNMLIARDEFQIPGLGKFGTKTQAARKGRNPATGQEINIPEKQVPYFKPATALKEEVNTGTTVS